MKRPLLVTGITAIAISALLILIKGAYLVILPVSAMVLFFYFIKKFKLRKFIVIPTVCITAIIICLSFFTYNKVCVSPYLKFDNTQATVYGKIVTTPSIENQAITFNLKVDKINTENVNTTVSVTLAYSDTTNLKLYDYVCINEASVYVPKDDELNYDFSHISDGVFLQTRGGNAQFIEECPKSPYYYCLQFKQLVSDSISSYMRADEGGLLKGMIFGDTSSISEDTFRAFRNSGIAHLLAVSGLHTSLWCGLLLSLFAFLKLSEKASAVICIAFLVLFCIISGMTPSVIRASVMMLIILVAPFFKRQSDGINALGFAITGLVLLNPYIVLSISFQLSACATFGVLVARSFYPKLTKLTQKINSYYLKHLTILLLKSLLISCFAGLFTLPVFAYYFGILCIVAPITNILCVQLAFYGMVFGTITVFVSFINIDFIRSICFVMFNVTEFMLNIVIWLATTVSEFRFATLPIRSDFLYLGLSVGLLCFLIGFIIFKRKENKKLLRITALVTALQILIITFIPVYSSHYKNTVTVLPCDDGVQLVIRSGANYAYVENTAKAYSSQASKALPLATCETLKYYIPTYLTSDNIENVSHINENYSPQNIVVTPTVRRILSKSNLQIPDSVMVKTNGKYVLSSQITFEIVDTTGIKYAIIKSKDKNIFVHLYGDTNIYKYVNASDFHTVIYNSTIPESITHNFSQIILCLGDGYDPIKLIDFTEKTDSHIHVTAKHGKAVIQM